MQSPVPEKKARTTGSDNIPVFSGWQGRGEGDRTSKRGLTFRPAPQKQSRKNCSLGGGICRFSLLFPFLSLPFPSILPSYSYMSLSGKVRVSCSLKWPYICCAAEDNLELLTLPPHLPPTRIISLNPVLPAHWASTPAAKLFPPPQLGCSRMLLAQDHRGQRMGFLGHSDTHNMVDIFKVLQTFRDLYPTDTTCKKIFLMKMALMVKTSVITGVWSLKSTKRHLKQKAKQIRTISHSLNV